MSAPFLSVVLAAALCVVNCKPAQAPTVKAPPSVKTKRAAISDITFLTYNVLADADGAGTRVPALMSILEGRDADVVALQEVAPWFLARLRAEPWIGRYSVVGVQPDGRAAGGLLILSKLPVKEVHVERLMGRQGRSVLVAVLERGSVSMAVASVHLESFLEDGPTQAKQLGRVFELLAPYEEGVLIGDYNFGDGERPETGLLASNYDDGWLSLRPGEPGYTWNMEVSPMARGGAFVGEGSRRLDRILVRSGALVPVSTAIVGAEPVRSGGRWFPSDHFGLAAKWREVSR